MMTTYDKIKMLNDDDDKCSTSSNSSSVVIKRNKLLNLRKRRRRSHSYSEQQDKSISIDKNTPKDCGNMDYNDCVDDDEDDDEDDSGCVLIPLPVKRILEPPMKRLRTCNDDDDDNDDIGEKEDDYDDDKEEEEEEENVVDDNSDNETDINSEQEDNDDDDDDDDDSDEEEEENEDESIETDVSDDEEINTKKNEFIEDECEESENDDDCDENEVDENDIVKVHEKLYDVELLKKNITYTTNDNKERMEMVAVTSNNESIPNDITRNNSSNNSSSRVDIKILDELIFNNDKELMYKDNYSHKLDKIIEELEIHQHQFIEESKIEIANVLDEFSILPKTSKMSPTFASEASISASSSLSSSSLSLSSQISIPTALTLKETENLSKMEVVDDEFSLIKDYKILKQHKKMKEKHIKGIQKKMMSENLISLLSYDDEPSNIVSNENNELQVYVTVRLNENNRTSTPTIEIYKNNKIQPNSSSSNNGDGDYIYISNIIKLVRRYDIIWNKNHPKFLHKNSGEKIKAWESIGELLFPTIWSTLDVDTRKVHCKFDFFSLILIFSHAILIMFIVNFLKEQWRKVRGCYLRYIKKLTEYVNGSNDKGNAVPPHKRFIYYDQMHFLNTPQSIDDEKNNNGVTMEDDGNNDDENYYYFDDSISNEIHNNNNSLNGNECDGNNDFIDEDDKLNSSSFDVMTDLCVLNNSLDVEKRMKFQNSLIQFMNTFRDENIAK